MAAPVDPFPNFVPGTLADGDQVDARFTALFAALDRSRTGLDAASIQDGIVTPQLTVVDPWQSVTLAGVPFGTPNTLEFMKDLMGMVRFKQKLYTFVAGQGPAAALATLPAGFRPVTTSYIKFLYVAASGASTGHFNCSIDTAGNVGCSTSGAFAATVFFTFAGHYRAEL